MLPKSSPIWEIFFSPKLSMAGDIGRLKSLGVSQPHHMGKSITPTYFATHLTIL